MTAWRQRIPPVGGPRELNDVRAAAQDLGLQAGHAPGKARLVFQTVADIAIITTSVIGSTLAIVALWKALNRQHHERRQDSHHEPAAAGRSPPRDAARRITATDADEGGGHGSHRHDARSR